MTAGTKISVCCMSYMQQLHVRPFKERFVSIFFLFEYFEVTIVYFILKNLYY